jgi:hypothetical protein
MRKQQREKTMIAILSKTMSDIQTNTLAEERYLCGKDFNK